jgi:hypothetical protein
MSALCQIQTFRAHQHQNRLDGSPWSEPRNPARDIGAEILVMGAKALSQHRLLVGQDKGVEREPQDPGVNQETPVAEQDPLAQDDSDDGDVHGIAHVAIEPRHHQVLRRCDRRRRAEPLQRKACKRSQADECQGPDSCPTFRDAPVDNFFEWMRSRALRPSSRTPSP